MGDQLLRLLLRRPPHYPALARQVDKHHVRSLDKFDDQIDLQHYNFASDRFHVYDGRGGRPACDLRKLSYRYRRVRDIYAQRREGTMNRKILAELIDTYQQTDAFANGWLSLAKRMLHKVSLIPGAVNIVVSACQLTPTLAKALVYQLDEFVPAENVYSGSQIGKLACFNQVMARFGDGAQYVAVGDGLEEEEVAEELNLPFHQIKKISDMKRLETLIDRRLAHHGVRWRGEQSHEL